MKILVTGGAGYIGSHTCAELLSNGHSVVVYDNLSNSSEKAIRAVEKITGKPITFYKGDIRDSQLLDTVFKKEKVDAVIHFAGLKAVGQSVEMPLEYYDNNINGTLTLCRAMAKAKVKRIIFSSSATVYGEPKKVPVKEDCPKGVCTNPYGWSKWMIEQILTDLHNSDKEWQVILLRYFNPVGAHPSGLIGEDPKGIPNNLMPYISQVAIGKRDALGVFGNDYPTHDGTGVRDYIHVVDLARGHLAALNHIDNAKVEIYNLGTGKGYSVLDILNAFSKTVGRPLPYIIKERRAGDIAECYCSPQKAKAELNWEATLTLEDMCKDAWRWQSENPNGYGE